MGKDSININISGGNAKFGNISQGNENTQQYQDFFKIKPEQIQNFYKQINEIANSRKIDKEQIELLKNEISDLRNISNQKNISNRLKRMYEQYSWAITPLKKLSSILLS